MPFTNVTTAITAATPITTPSSVSTERSLFAHSDASAIFIASAIFMNGSSPAVLRCAACPQLSHATTAAKSHRCRPTIVRQAVPLCAGCRLILPLFYRSSCRFRRDKAPWDGRTRLRVGAHVQWRGEVSYMPIRDSFLPEFDHEMANTRKTLERVPDDKWDWKPHPKSTTLGRLAAHVGIMPQWAIMTFDRNELDIRPPAGQ